MITSDCLANVGDTGLQQKYTENRYLQFIILLSKEETITYFIHIVYQ